MNKYIKLLWLHLCFVVSDSHGAVDTNMNVESDLSEDIRAYLAEKTLELAMKHTLMYNLADKFPISAGQGHTFKIVKYGRLALPQSPLTQGTTPSKGAKMVVTTVTAIADQWGDFVTLTDIAMLTITHPTLKIANELIAKQAMETLDRELQEALDGATNIQYADKDNAQVNNSRDDLAAEDVLATAELQLTLANLRNSGAPEFDGNSYKGVVDPSVEMDIINDTTFVTAESYAGVIKLENAEIGKWMGIRFIRDNFLQTYTADAAVTAAKDATVGTLTAVAHDVVVVGRNKQTGFDEVITLMKNITPDADDSIEVTMPADDDYTYDIYLGTSAAGAKLTSLTDQVANDVVVVSAVGTGVAAPIAPSADGVKVHNVWVFGKGAFGVTELKYIERYLTPAKESDSDPLAQRRKTGWKAYFKGVILNNAFMRRIECGSAF